MKSGVGVEMCQINSKINFIRKHKIKNCNCIFKKRCFIYIINLIIILLINDYILHTYITKCKNNSNININEET